MKKLLILSGKGGTGKTTTAAAFIRFAGARAVADCDMDAPNLALVSGDYPETRETDFKGSDKAKIDENLCIGCGKCAEMCRFGAISPAGDSKYAVDELRCEGCGLCTEVCPAGAARLDKDIAGLLRVRSGDVVFADAELRMGRGNSGKLVTEVKRALYDAAGEAELAIIENIQRENLNIFEQASSIASLIDIYNLTQEDAARQLSMSQSFVANKLRILRLTQPERDKILEYNLTERHARALLKVDSVEQRLRIIEYINSHSLNVATTEAYIDRMLAESGRKSNPRSPKRIILKDIRLFYNSLDKAVSLVRQAGIDIRTERTESDSNIDIVITIPKPPR